MHFCLFINWRVYVVLSFGTSCLHLSLLYCFSFRGNAAQQKKKKTQKSKTSKRQILKPVYVRAWNYSLSVESSLRQKTKKYSLTKIIQIKTVNNLTKSVRVHFNNKLDKLIRWLMHSESSRAVIISLSESCCTPAPALWYWATSGTSLRICLPIIQFFHAVNQSSEAAVPSLLRLESSLCF